MSSKILVRLYAYAIKHCLNCCKAHTQLSQLVVGLPSGVFFLALGNRGTLFPMYSTSSAITYSYVTFKINIKNYKVKQLLIGVHIKAALATCYTPLQLCGRLVVNSC